MTGSLAYEIVFYCTLMSARSAESADEPPRLPRGFEPGDGVEPIA
jgi:hypothetical protein